MAITRITHPAIVRSPARDAGLDAATRVRNFLRPRSLGNGEWRLPIPLLECT
jgi:hypothetical protein